MHKCQFQERGDFDPCGAPAILKVRWVLWVGLSREEQDVALDLEQTKDSDDDYRNMHCFWKYLCSHHYRELLGYFKNYPPVYPDHPEAPNASTVVPFEIPLEDLT